MIVSNNEEANNEEANNEEANNQEANNEEANNEEANNEEANNEEVVGGVSICWTTGTERRKSFFGYTFLKLNVPSRKLGNGWLNQASGNRAYRLVELKMLLR